MTMHHSGSPGAGWMAHASNRVIVSIIFLVILTVQSCAFAGRPSPRYMRRQADADPIGDLSDIFGLYRNSPVSGDSRDQSLFCGLARGWLKEEFAPLFDSELFVSIGPSHRRRRNVKIVLYDVDGFVASSGKSEGRFWLWEVA